MFVDAAAGVEGIWAERDSHNNQYSASLPAVTPVEIASILPVAFSGVEFQQRKRLRNSFAATPIDHLGLYGKFQTAVRNDNRLKAILSSQSSSTPFQEARAVFGIEFQVLRDYCGGVSTSNATTASPEADFSNINWEKNYFPTDMSLERIMHTKQYACMAQLRHQ
jgi:hypothetical protein